MSFLLDLAIILLFTKLLGLLVQKLQIPQVVGNLLGGLLIGPAILGWVSPSENLTIMAQIGVIMIMFSAGLETDLKSLKSTGVASIIITLFGVFVPLGLGFLIAIAFNGGFVDMTQQKVLHCLFYGVILTATSVSVTVATLKEMGKLNSKVGATILSAALIDDILGLFILTVVLGMSGSGSSNIGKVALNTFLFFIFAGAVGFLINKLFQFLSRRYPNTRRLSIFGLVVCLLMAYSAEKLFGIADVTGAFVAGVALSNQKDTAYVEEKIDTTSYMIFAPIFFANIGLQASFNNFTWALFGLAMAFAAVGLLSKFFGCSAGARLCKFNRKDSVRIGLGMMARAEVALIVAQKGVTAKLIEPSMLTVVLVLVILSSLVTPILLKITYKKGKHEPKNDNEIPHTSRVKPISESDYDDFLISGNTKTIKPNEAN